LPEIHSLKSQQFLSLNGTFTIANHVGVFLKSWAHCVKRKPTQIWEKPQGVGRKAQVHDAKLGKKDGRRAQMLSIGGKLLYEIHPQLKYVLNLLFIWLHYGSFHILRMHLHYHFIHHSK
jgi:hypothetical protein